MSRLAKDLDVTHLPQQTRTGVVISYPEVNPLSRWRTDSKIRKDIDIAHSRRWPERPMSLASCSWLLMTSPGLRLILLHRINHWLYLKREYESERKRLWRAISILLVPLKKAIKIDTKSQIANDIEIEGGVCFSDQGHIISGAIKTGEGTVIGARVTLGMSLIEQGRPKIGCNVWIGSDCVIYGAISVGNGATLLPGTVLTKTIPSGVVMQGNPARLVLRNFDNSELLKHRNIDALKHVNATQGA
jgi:serine acetyltransferase